MLSVKCLLRSSYPMHLPPRKEWYDSFRAQLTGFHQIGNKNTNVRYQIPPRAHRARLLAPHLPPVPPDERRLDPRLRADDKRLGADDKELVTRPAVKLEHACWEPKPQRPGRRQTQFLKFTRRKKEKVQDLKSMSSSGYEQSIIDRNKSQ